jgi:trimethylamine---corrinoid protein Co-methyltransferase
MGCSHTQADFETVIWRSQITDNNSYEQWHDDGEKDSSMRVNALWNKMLADYEAPALDAGLGERLQALMAKRKETLPDGVS